MLDQEGMELVSRKAGFHIVKLDSWRTFVRCFLEDQTFVDLRIFRGQCVDEPLLSRIGRIQNQKGRERTAGLTALQLERFKYECRGRRGDNPRGLDDDEMWALGQHFGLATPLLDWTMSPMVALFFAFWKTAAETKEYRVVFSLDTFPVYHNEALSELRGESFDQQSASEGDQLAQTCGKRAIPNRVLVKVIRPKSDENRRLISQRGLFVRSTRDDMPLEEWIMKSYQDDHWVGNSPFLIKYLIPNQEVAVCLEALDAMNINHATLFPDLEGAAMYCNWLLSEE